MGLFTGGIAHVGGTKIFARLAADEEQGVSQYLVYSMSMSADSDVAMILPLPVSSQSEDAVEFIPLSDYPEFFEDMVKGFPAPLGERGKGTSDPESTPGNLSVQAVGDFVASFVPTLADFDKLDARFRLPAATWDKLPQYHDWGFVVFQLGENPANPASANGTARQIHPMAFRFRTDMDESLYFPTLHVQDGKFADRAEFDHTLYFQGDEFQDFADAVSQDNADAFMKVEKAMGILQANAVFGKRSIVGTYANEDTYVARPE
jgi:hypothetical protein